MRSRDPMTSGVILALLAGCSPAPPEVAGSGITGDPEGSTDGTTTEPAAPTTEGSATAASAEGTGSSVTSEGPATTMPLDGTGTTDAPPATSGSSSEGPGDSSSDGGMMESSGTGEPADCHPLLAEVLYDPSGGNGGKQWIRLYNPCPDDIDLAGYSLGWGGTDYAANGADLMGSILAGGCFLVGGPMSIDDNYFPRFDLQIDFSGDLQSSGAEADGVALFDDVEANVAAATIPVDAVIYGESNTSGLIDAEGNVPSPHVGDASSSNSIRRTAVEPTWIIESSPTPNECPAL